MLNPDAFTARVSDAVATIDALRDPVVVSAALAAADVLSASLIAGGKVLLCGNGGSAADAQHLAAELVGRFYLERRPLPAIALPDNGAAMTAIANDYSYEDTFVRAVNAFGRPGDVLVGLSTSGESANVVRAFSAAQELGVHTVALVGARPCRMREMADIALCAPSESTARIQEAHKVLGHIVFEMVEATVCSPDRAS